MKLAAACRWPAAAFFGCLQQKLAAAFLSISILPEDLRLPIDEVSSL